MFTIPILGNIAFGSSARNNGANIPKPHHLPFPHIPAPHANTPRNALTFPPISSFNASTRDRITSGAS